MKKWKSSRGETLVETLAAILLVTLASVLFLQMTSSAARIHQTTKTADAAFQSDLAAAETQSGTPAPGTVTISGTQGSVYSRNYGVDVYTSGGLTSYAANGDTP